MWRMWDAGSPGCMYGEGTCEGNGKLYPPGYIYGGNQVGKIGVQNLMDNLV